MSVLDKFILSKEDEEKLKDDFASLLSEKTGKLMASYRDAFKALPYETLEAMTDEQAQKLSKEILEEALKSLRQQYDALNAEIRKLAKDEKRMDAIREKFLKELEEEAKVKAEVPDVEKNTLKE